MPIPLRPIQAPDLNQVSQILERASNSLTGGLDTAAGTFDKLQERRARRSSNSAIVKLSQAKDAAQLQRVRDSLFVPADQITDGLLEANLGSQERILGYAEQEARRRQADSAVRTNDSSTANNQSIIDDRAARLILAQNLDKRSTATHAQTLLHTANTHSTDQAEALQGIAETGQDTTNENALGGLVSAIRQGTLTDDDTSIATFLQTNFPNANVATVLSGRNELRQDEIDTSKSRTDAATARAQQTSEQLVLDEQIRLADEAAQVRAVTEGIDQIGRELATGNSPYGTRKEDGSLDLDEVALRKRFADLGVKDIPGAYNKVKEYATALDGQILAEARQATVDKYSDPRFLNSTTLENKEQLKRHLKGNTNLSGENLELAADDIISSTAWKERVSDIQPSIKEIASAEAVVDQETKEVAEKDFGVDFNLFKSINSEKNSLFSQEGGFSRAKFSEKIHKSGNVNRDHPWIGGEEKDVREQVGDMLAIGAAAGFDEETSLTVANRVIFGGTDSNILRDWFSRASKSGNISIETRDDMVAIFDALGDASGFRGANSFASFHDDRVKQLLDAKRSDVIQTTGRDRRANIASRGLSTANANGSPLNPDRPDLGGPGVNEQELIRRILEEGIDLRDPGAALLQRLGR